MIHSQELKKAHILIVESLESSVQYLKQTLQQSFELSTILNHSIETRKQNRSKVVTSSSVRKQN